MAQRHSTAKNTHQVTISLPYLFVAGVFTAPVGALLLLSQLRWPCKATLVAGGLGGALSWLFLQYITISIEQDFMGWYKPAAWGIVFFAGYAPAAAATCAWRFASAWKRKT